MSSPSRSEGEDAEEPAGSEPGWAPRSPGAIRGIDLRRPIPATWLLLAALWGTHLWAGWVQWRLGRVDAWGAWVLERDVRFRVASGGQYLMGVEQGEGWRLWTSVFLHVDALHLLLNSVALFTLGRLLEPWIGGLRWGAWFCAGGLAGSAMSHLAGLNQSDGASGGAFALLGAAVVLGWSLRARLPPEDSRLMGPVLWGFVGLNLLLSVLIPAIDAVGHLGGLAAGALLALAVGLNRSRIVAGAEALWLGSFAAVCLLGWAGA